MSVGTIIGKADSFNLTISVSDPQLKRGEFVIVQHDTDGLVLGVVKNIFREKKNGKIESTAEASIIGFKDEENIKRIPKTPFTPGNLVWKADEKFIANVLSLNKNSEEGLYIGLLDGYSKMKISINPAALLTKHIAVLAQSGGGKSYAVGVLLEELIEKQIPLVIIDPHGEYSTLAEENSNKREIELMQKFEVKPKAFYSAVREFVAGNEMEGDKVTVSDKNLSSRDLNGILPAKLNSQQLFLLYEALKSLKEKQRDADYHLGDLLKNLEAVESGMKWGLVGALEELMDSGIFSEHPTNLKELVKPNQAAIINLKGVNLQQQQILVTRLLNDLFRARKMEKIPAFLLVVEEAHNFAPERNFGEVATSGIMRTIASEGRKFGLGLCVVTQRPARIDKSIVSQCSTQLILKMTNPNDIKSVSASIEKFDDVLAQELPGLEPGTAFLCGESAETNLKVRIRIRKTLHGGSAQAVIKKKKVKKSIDMLFEAPITAKKTIDSKDIGKNFDVSGEINHPLWMLTAKTGKLFVDAVHEKIYTAKIEHIDGKKVSTLSFLLPFAELQKFNDNKLMLLNELLSNSEVKFGQETANKLQIPLNELKDLLNEFETCKLVKKAPLAVDNFYSLKLSNPTISKDEEWKLRQEAEENEGFALKIDEKVMKKAFQKNAEALESIQLIKMPLLICSPKGSNEMQIIIASN